jgi:quercetin dioxygenase-like cupin family protein
MKPGSLLPEHKHLHEQISYILNGEVEATVGAARRTLRPGDLFSVKSNTSHSCRALGQPVRMVVASSPLLRDYVFGEE